MMNTVSFKGTYDKPKKYVAEQKIPPEMDRMYAKTLQTLINSAAKNPVNKAVIEDIKELGSYGYSLSIRQAPDEDTLELDIRKGTQKGIDVTVADTGGGVYKFNTSTSRVRDFDGIFAKLADIFDAFAPERQQTEQDKKLDELIKQMKKRK